MRFFILILSLFLKLFGSNHLANESSPYLQQHKNNPVAWYPWGKEALNKAKQHQKLIFLSIGYSTCHWCHVMAQEDFEDKEIAQLLNKYFISIKVDKEEYPQLDSYYQKIYKDMHHKRAGWPLTIIMTPNKKVLFSGTYIPKYAAYGSEGLMHILNTFATLSPQQYRKKAYIQTPKNQQKILPMQKRSMVQNIVSHTYKSIQSNYDAHNGGFFTHPKFPHPSILNTLVDIAMLTHNNNALSMVTSTLDTMAKSGLYDQISGGFFRYCVNEKWTIPHFEKMLYTNAELIDIYTRVWNITHNPLYKKIVTQTIHAIDTTFLKNGLYSSASDAQSYNAHHTLEEGYYFLFSFEETLHYLTTHHIPRNDAIQALAYLDIQEDGNFDGELSQPHITHAIPPQNINTIIALLNTKKQQRAHPFIDYKRNTAWNALYIGAKLRTYTINPRFVYEALQALDILLQTNMPHNKLYHISVHNTKPTRNALLEDYAFLSDTLLQAYQITLNNRYLHTAQKLLNEAYQKFYINGVWYLSDDTLHVEATLEDQLYKSPLAVLFKSYCFIGSVTHQKYLYTTQKQTLLNALNKLYTTPTHYATALQVWFENYYGEFFIKSKKSNLLPLLYKQWNYPYIYLYATQEKSYEICGLKNCYTQTTTQNKMEQSLQSILRTIPPQQQSLSPENRLTSFPKQ